MYIPQFEWQWRAFFCTELIKQIKRNDENDFFPKLFEKGYSIDIDCIKFMDSIYFINDSSDT